MEINIDIVTKIPFFNLVELPMSSSNICRLFFNQKEDIFITSANSNVFKTSLKICSQIKSNRQSSEVNQIVRFPINQNC